MKENFAQNLQCKSNFKDDVNKKIMLNDFVQSFNNRGLYKKNTLDRMNKKKRKQLKT